MSPQKSARITGPPKKALDFSKSVRLNMRTLFFARKEVQEVGTCKGSENIPICRGCAIYSSKKRFVSNLRLYTATPFPPRTAPTASVGPTPSVSLEVEASGRPMTRTPCHVELSQVFSSTCGPIRAPAWYHWLIIIKFQYMNISKAIWGGQRF